MSKVYITNDGGQDFTKAEQFGNLVKLTRGSVDVFKLPKVKDEIYAKLAGFNAREDFLLVCGSAIAGAIAGAYLSVHGDDGRSDKGVLVKFLIFDSKTHDYFIRTVEV